jgi:hypothetical protein
MSGSIYSGNTSPTPYRRAGIASLTIDGEVFDLVGDLTYDATVVTREELIGQSGFQGVTEMPKPGRIGATIRDAGTMTVSAFMAKVDANMVGILINGKTIQGDQMICRECSEVKTQEASFTIMFVGNVTENPI